VPGDIGLIGLNDMEMARWHIMGLTTIRQPLDRIIPAAIDLVVAAIRSPEQPPEVRLFPCELVERQTLRAVPR
jgi:DNA-binding LacI/PurR family transcriptional regulator